MIKARNSAATPDARTKNKRVCYSSTLAHLAKTAQKKEEERTPPRRQLAVSPSRRVISPVSWRWFRGGRGGMNGAGAATRDVRGIWRRRRKIAADAGTSPSRGHLSTAEYKWLSELFQSMILMAGDQE